jgi:hypothetical protein
MAVLRRIRVVGQSETLRVTPAMEAGISDHVLGVDELVALLPQPQAKKRGPYKEKLAA